MAHRDELADYIADNYGTCDRGSDCYHGTNGAGRFDGCLRTVWRGRGCANWHPIEARTLSELKTQMGTRYGVGTVKQEAAE